MRIVSFFVALLILQATINLIRLAKSQLLKTIAGASGFLLLVGNIYMAITFDAGPLGLAEIVALLILIAALGLGLRIMFRRPH